MEDSPTKSSPDETEEGKPTPTKPRYSTHMKKHRDLKTANPQPYMWGIRPGPIFEHHETISRLMELNGKPVRFQTPEPAPSPPTITPNEDMKPTAKRLKLQVASVAETAVAKVKTQK